MSGKDSDKHVFSYIDGIPVKISEKYKPPQRIVLPVGFQNRLLQPPVSAEYDFSFEEKILDKLLQMRDLRHQEKEKRKERVDAEDSKHRSKEVKVEAPEETSQGLSTEDNFNPANGSVTTPPPFTSTDPEHMSQHLSSFTVCASVIRENNPILRPIPIKHHVVTSQINNNKPISAFNLSDFEADTSSPFDNMELKTINDLEELAQVLQPSVVSHPPEYYSTTVSSEQHSGQHTVDQNQSFNPSSNVKLLNDSKTLINYQPHLNGFTSNYSLYNSMAPSSLQTVDSYQSHIPGHSYHPPSVIVPTGSCDQSVPYNFLDREQVTQGSSMHFDFNAFGPQRKVQHIYSNNMWPSSGTFGVTRNNATSHSFKLSSPGPEELSASRKLPSSPPSSPDQSGGQIPTSESAIQAVAQELSQLLKLKSSKVTVKFSSPLSEDKSANPASSAILPDPILSLQPEDQLLAQKLLEMGFPCARVARSFRALGASDKVLESLLSLQSLLDAGYPEDRAEHALQLNDYDIGAATRFLEAEKQLLDLGFSREQVAEALLKCSCNRDKALDLLLS